MRFLPRFLLVAGSVVAVACQQNTVANPALPLEAPASISSISLDSAIFLDWADNAFLNDPTRFSNYRIYGTSYDLDHGVCGTTWAVEGTTVSHVFLAAELANGVPRCFATSAITAGTRWDRGGRLRSWPMTGGLRMLAGAVMTSLGFPGTWPRLSAR